MFRRNSIFRRMLLSLIAVLFFQTIIIGAILLGSGVLDTLDAAAVKSMKMSSENRSITLEMMMNAHWGNIDELEKIVKLRIGSYLNSNWVTLDELMTNEEHQKTVLGGLSDTLIRELRYTSATGIFMHFTGRDIYVETPKQFMGLYYRDLNPDSTPEDNSDLLFLRGSHSIARENKIQLDSLWTEKFNLMPEDSALWDSYAKPYRAALDNVGISAKNLSYWSRVHFRNSSEKDANACITYTRPIIVNGRVVAMIGTEVLANHLNSFFPAGDYENTGKTGYMLMRYDTDRSTENSNLSKVLMTTGSYINRIVQTGDEIAGISEKYSNVREFATSDGERLLVFSTPLDVYGKESVFANEKWELASVGIEDLLFSVSNRLVTSLWIGFISVLAIGSFFLWIVVSTLTNPIISLTSQLKTKGDEALISDSSKIYEVKLLADTINQLRYRRSIMTMRFQEEHERYRLALESTTDTFVEFDFEQDKLLLFYFSNDKGESHLHTKEVDGFSDKATLENLVAPNDLPILVQLMEKESTDPVEIRVSPDLFSHIKSNPAEDGYFWLSMKGVHLSNEDGKFTKLICAAREITAEKVREFLRVERERSDTTTGFYGAKYGLEQIAERTNAAGDKHFVILSVRLDSFDQFEIRYGRAFASAVIMSLARDIKPYIGNDDIAIRLNNDEFIFFMDNMRYNQVMPFAKKIIQIGESIYTGEAKELSLNIHVGITFNGDGANSEELIYNARLAAYHPLLDNEAYGVIYKDLTAEDKNADLKAGERPIVMSIDASKENAGEFAFELFERTYDGASAFMMLLEVLGPMFSLKSIIVSSYDADFRAGYVLRQWNKRDVLPHHTNIVKVSEENLNGFEKLFGQENTLVFTHNTVKDCDADIRDMLCVPKSEEFCAYCCLMNESGVQTGRVTFILDDKRQKWEQNELRQLYDVTKLMAVQLSSERHNSASRFKSVFLANMSHEIRTPMNLIIGMLSIAKSSLGDKERLIDCLDKIDLSAKHLLTLVNDVLDMSRIESGKMEINLAPVSIKRFAQDLDTFMRPIMDKAEINFVTEVDLSHGRVFGDEHRLRQVIINLLSNASKFTPAGGSVIFSIKEVSSDLYKFSVKDTGTGISTEDQAQIFGAFAQARLSSSAQKQQGAGLGLAISANLIGLMGGTIELNSRVGEGSDFYFTLKMEPQIAQLPDKESENKPLSQKDICQILDGKRVLLVEDNEINVEIASYILNEAGMRVEVAYNGREGVDKFFDSPVGYFDIILMDVQMPVMDGHTATRSIRKNTKRGDADTIPIIATTANAFDEDMRKSLRAGMNGHISKPIDPQEMLELLAQMLKK